MAEFDMPSRYDATITEAKWYAKWEEAGLFQPDPDETKPKFCITIPPPNITGSLHMGHALCYPIQDMLGRYQRMRGKRVLILPGQDHAGIATQSVVSKQLKKEGASAAEMGREKFVERVWEWRRESGDTILHQLRSLGCAFDWTRTRFTLDPQYHDAVLNVFIDWFERGLIFRGKRVVNWDPVLRTSVSDIETERQTIRGKLYHIRYDFTDGSGSITIATTRPETMLADVAVAVHPSDKRYTDKIGKTLRLPLVGREIPLIADIYPDPNFGTGAVKITPAHDPNDFQVGQRHSLEMPVILDERARVTLQDLESYRSNDSYATYKIDELEGLDRYEARRRIVAALEESGQLEKIEDHDINIVVSDRSKEVIEPLLSEQWFCDQATLAGPAIEAVKQGKIKFSPERYERIFLDWMENIREWCISRQLWWGHRIPIYYTEDGTPIAALNWEDAQQKADQLAGGESGAPHPAPSTQHPKRIVRQDDDVLDTWFSSGLWPFATLGWPEKTDDLKTWYPTSVLVTDRNIINLWVARMVMMGIDFMGEIPFSEVMIYATVLTEDGKRMSKSLGTGVDPMGIIETKGADALRWTLMSQTGQNQDIRYSEKKTDDARNWANKIWNATRFILINAPSAQLENNGAIDEAGEGLETVDRWLLSRLHATEKIVRDAYDGYDLQTACQALYQFFWNELCDWYIEISKPRLQDQAQRIVPTRCLLTSIEAFLKMLHPIMPHLTEELYSHLPVEGKSSLLMGVAWPWLPEDLHDGAAEVEMARTIEIVTAIRALRHSLDITPLKVIPEIYLEGDLGRWVDVVRSQAWIADIKTGRPSDRHLSITRADLTVHLPIDGLVDVEKVLAASRREQDKLAEELGRLTKRLANLQFVERAKPEVIQADRDACRNIRARLDGIDARIALLGNGP